MVIPLRMTAERPTGRLARFSTLPPEDSSQNADHYRKNDCVGHDVVVVGLTRKADG
jgi:hypothetical protein